MFCSGCGKDIPFNGSVCPYCQRDKSKDQAYMVMAFIFSIIGGAIGYFIFGFWGVIGGFVLGCIIAAVVTSGGGTKAPEVQLAPASQSPEAEDSVATKLAQLKQLHEQGLLTDEEFTNKKADILAKF